jgi:uncharacterized protein YndB with AHSA1/START domain
VEKKKTHVFDAPIEQVWAMFRDPDSHVEKFRRLGHRNIEVQEHAASEDHVRLVIARDVTVDLPGFARKVLSPTNHVVSTDEWSANGDGTYGGDFEAVTKGAPVRITGTTLISPEGDDRTRYDLTTQVTIKVPMIGRKLTAWAEDDVERQMEEQFAAGDAWLAEHAG